MKKIREWWNCFKNFIRQLIPKTNVFLYSIVMVLCIGFTLSICKISHLNSRLDTQNTLIIQIFRGDKETEQNLKLQKFKEDSYLRQQEKDTELIMMYIPCVFLIITFLSYGNIQDVINRFKKYVEAKTKYYDEEHKKLHIDLVGIQNDLDREIGFLRESEANNYLNIDKFTDYVSMYLTAISYFSRCYVYYKEQKDTTEEQSALFHILKAINKVVEIVDKNNIEIDKSETLSKTKEIRENTNEEVSLQLSKIETKLNLK